MTIPNPNFTPNGILQVGQPAQAPVAQVPIAQAPVAPVAPVAAQPTIHLAPVGIAGVPAVAQAPQAAVPNPIAGVSNFVQDNKRELTFAAVGALAVTLLQGNSPFGRK